MPANSEASDAELMQAAQTDPSAFDALYRRYLPAVFRYCLIRLGSTEDAEDVTATVFLDALGGLANYREQGRFNAWLFTIARRRVSTYQAREARQRSIEASGVVESATEAPLEERLLLGRAMAQLSEGRREALALRFFGGLKVAEVAQVMGKRESAVKMLVHRGLAQLRELLRENPDG